MLMAPRSMAAQTFVPFFFLKKYFFPKKIEVWIFKSLCMLVIKSKAWFLG